MSKSWSMTSSLLRELLVSLVYQVPGKVSQQMLKSVSPGSSIWNLFHNSGSDSLPVEVFLSLWEKEIC